MVLAETLCALFLLLAAAVVISGGPFQIRFWGFRSMMRFLVFETYKTDYFYCSKEPTRFKLLICGLQPGQNFIASLFFRENPRWKKEECHYGCCFVFVFSLFQPQYSTLGNFFRRGTHIKLLKAQHICLASTLPPSPPPSPTSPTSAN